MRVKKLIGRLYLWLFRWRREGGPPPLDRYVLVLSPHTSNWDFPNMLAFAWAFGLRDIRWVGKHTLFRFPLGLFMRWAGGLPVDRTAAHDTVTQLAEQFASRERLILGVAPSGTRKYRDHWKSGFYHVALAAGVPIVLAYLDYGQRRGGIGPPIELTGDVAADMDRVRTFYADKQGRDPERVSRIRLQIEDREAD